MGDFINPGMAWFALAGLIPIIIHLLNRQRYKRIRWAAMEFLLEAMKKTRRRLQLENLILLAIRVLIVVLLSLALARCYFRQTPLAALGTVDTHAIILLDNSYSMGYKSGNASVFDEAKTIAHNIIDRLKTSQGDKVSLLTLSAKPAVVISEASANLEIVKKAVANLQLSDYGTSCYDTLLLAKDIVAKSKSSRKVIYLVTDGQRLAWQNREENKAKFTELLAQLGTEAELKIIDLGKDNAPNSNINGLRPAGRVIQVGKTANFEVEINNFNPLSLANIEISFYVDNLKQNTASVPVGSFGTATTNFTYEFPEAGPHQIKVVLEPDSLNLDNERYLSVDVRDAVPVLIVNGAPSADPYADEAMYLRYALQPSRTESDRFSIYSVDTVRDIVFEETDIKKYDLIILANLEYLSQEKLKALEEYVRSGGGLLIFLGNKIDRRFYNESLYRKGAGLLPGELIEILGDKEHQNYVKLDKIDFNHESLSYFKPIKEYLSRILIYEYYRMKLDLPEKDAAAPDKPESNPLRVLARYNDADENPALVEKTFGKGKVMVVTTAADIEWSNLPASPGGVILFDNLAKYLAIPSANQKNIRAGDPLKLILKPSAYSPTFSMIMPGRGIKFLSPGKLPEGNFLLTCPETDTEEIGFYSLERQGSEDQEKLLTYFSVNLDPLEGNLKKTSAEELKQLYPGFKFEWFKNLNERQEEAVGKPPASNIWKYLIWTVFGLILLETILAQRFGSVRK